MLNPMLKRPRSLAAAATQVACTLLLIAFGGCAKQSVLSSDIARHFESGGQKSVNLGEAAPFAWERVCILGPYSDNQAARRTLGFEWDAERNTSIKNNEGVALLLFLDGNTVVEYTEHRRAFGDFTNLTGRCFKRDSAVFIHVPNPPKGWPGLFPRDEGMTPR